MLNWNSMEIISKQRSEKYATPEVEQFVLVDELHNLFLFGIQLQYLVRKIVPFDKKLQSI